jgi:hypothetical protein
MESKMSKKIVRKRLKFAWLPTKCKGGKKRWLQFVTITEAFDKKVEAENMRLRLRLGPMYRENPEIIKTPWKLISVT